jgi:plasmid maintenance system antidote protein VapI
MKSKYIDLQRLMLDKNIKQFELVSKMGVSQTTISRLCGGNYPLSNENAKKLQDIFGNISEYYIKKEEEDTSQLRKPKKIDPMNTIDSQQRTIEKLADVISKFMEDKK